MDRHLLLLARTPLLDLFQYLKKACAPGIEVDRESVAREWRRAAERIRELETQEAGLADNPAMASLSSAAADFAESHVRTASAQRALCLTPHRWCVVDIDLLLVYQKAINQTFAHEIESALGPSISEHDLLRVALGAHGHPPPVSIRQTGDTIFTISSPSSDIRTLGAAVLAPADIAGCHCSGRPIGALAIFVGFGLNCITALSFRNRLILINGMHRAYALRCRGIKQVPCLVQEITHDEELDIIATGEIRQRIDRYIRLGRPPLLKDYFDPCLTKRIDMPRTHAIVQIQVSSQCIAAPMPCEATRL